MNTGCSVRSWISGVGCCLLVVAALALPAGASAAQRMVMAEDITSIDCVYCPAVGQSLADIMDANPERFVMVQVHGTFGNDPYKIYWGYAIREPYYQVTGFPTTVQDGILRRVGQYSSAQYLADFNARKTVATDVTVDVGGGVISGQTYRLTAWVGLEPTGVAKTVRVYIVQLLDHYPTGGTHNRNCLRQVGMHGSAYYEDVALTPGQSASVQVTMTFSGVDWTNREDMKILAWAQKTGAFPAASEIYQAGVMNWPFMNDCNANGIADESDILNGTSLDCNTNSIPDECDVANCANDPACGDCNGNGVPDSCDGYAVVDCDLNGLSDECELEQNPGLDCNGNTVVDPCDIISGLSLDCNANLVPDECDRSSCDGSPWCDDCNNNGTMDYCDLHIDYAAQSGHLSPLGTPTVQTFTLIAPPFADGDVTLNFNAVGDLNFSNESVAVDLNGTPIGTLWQTGGQDCTEVTASVVVTSAVYNAALTAGSGDMAIHMTPSSGVAPAQCTPATWIEVGITYLGVPPSADANQNGIPDECETPTLCPGDSDCDGQVSFSDIDLFVASIPDDAASWAALYAARHGGAEPPCAFLNNDCTNDGQVTFADIDPFVAMIPSACP